MDNAWILTIHCWAIKHKVDINLARVMILRYDQQTK